MKTRWFSTRRANGIFNFQLASVNLLKHTEMVFICDNESYNTNIRVREDFLIFLVDDEVKFHMNISLFHLLIV